MSYKIYNKYWERYYEWNKPSITIKELKELMGYTTGVWKHPKHNFKQTYKVILNNNVYHENEHLSIDISSPTTVDIKLQSPYIPFN